MGSEGSGGASATGRSSAPSGAATEEPTVSIDRPPPSVEQQGREIPETIGRYAVERRIGRGGMGVVVAARDMQLDRVVAIKLLRSHRIERGAAPPQALLREARVLASLSHPNIVEVFDVGIVEGEVFIAMEFVEGQTLRRWLDSGDRKPREVLDILLAAGRGLNAAHGDDVIHLDFKPSNVLIGADGRARVVDFGLAFQPRGGGGGFSRTARPSPSSESAGGSRDASTRNMFAMGTPAYMSPEQHAGETVDARSDQFSYCVTLYEALYGRRPFPGKGKKLRSCVRRGHIDRSPRPPGVTPRLERIIKRGLAPDPDDRWPSMNALLAAVERARRRTRWGQRATVVAGVAMVGLVAAVPRLSAPSAACEELAETAGRTWSSDRVATLREAYAGSGAPWADEAAERVVATLDRYAEGLETLRQRACNASGSGQLGERRVACLHRRLAAMDALVDTVIAADRPTLQRAPGAAAQLPRIEDCSAAESELPSGPAVESDDVESVRVALARVKAIEDSGHYKAALAEVRAAVVRANETSNRPLRAEALHRLGRLLALTEDPEAEATLTDAAMVAAAAGHDVVAAAAAGELIYQIGFREGRFGDAEIWVGHGRAAVERGAKNTSTHAAFLTKEAAVASVRGDYDAAERGHRRALEMWTEVVGRRSPSVVAALNNLGGVLFMRGDHAGAMTSYDEALELSEELFGPQHPTIADVLQNIAGVHHALGRYEESLRYVERAIAIDRLEYGQESLRMATSSNNRGILLEALERFDAAEEAHAQALAIREELLPTTSPLIPSSRSNLAGVLVSRGEFGRARAQYLRASEEAAATLGEQHRVMATVQQGLGEAELGLGHPHRALESFERALAIRLAIDSPAAYLADTRLALATTLRDVGRDQARARDIAERASEFYADAGPAYAIRRAEVAELLDTLPKKHD